MQRPTQGSYCSRGLAKHHSTGWPANGVHQDAKPREQLHALVAAPRLRVGAIDCIVRTKEAPSSSKEYREGQEGDHAGHKRCAEPLPTKLRATR